MSCSGRDDLERVVNITTFQISFYLLCYSITTVIYDRCIVRIVLNFNVEGVEKLVVSLRVEIDFYGKHIMLLFPYPWELGNIGLLRSRTS